MFKNLLKKMILPVCIVIVVVVILAVRNYLTFHITGTSPFNTYAGSLSINFNENVKQSSIKVSASPNIIFNYTLGSPKTIKIELTSTPVANTVYTFKVTATSSKGQSINSSTLRLKASAANFSGLSTSQQQTLVNSQDNTVKVAANKIFTILPYYSTYYYLIAQNNGTNKPNIVFTYLPPPSFLPATVQAEEPTKQTLISQAEAWLDGEGITISNYNFIDSATGQPIN